MNWKKILTVIGFVAVTVGLGYLLYFVFLRKAAPPPTAVVPPVNAPPAAGLPVALPGVPAPTAAPVPAVLPTAAPILKPPTPLPPIVSEIAKGGLTWTATLTDRPITNLKLAPDGKNLQYYDSAEGKFYRITQDGKTTLLSDKIFPSVAKASWSPDANKAILEFPDGANVLFDFSTQKQVTLPQHWEQFDFSPDSSQIAGLSIGTDINNRWLFVSNSDGSNSQPIEPIGDNADKIKVSWSPNNQIVATARTAPPMGFDQQMIIMVGKNGENFKGLVVDGWGFDYKWSPTGKRMLYNAYNSNSGYKPLLWISDAQGDSIGANRKNLQINTWAEKCAYADENTVYCAVPQTMEEGAGMLPNLNDTVPDDFYKIDMKTGLKSLVATPYVGVTADNVSVSGDGTYMFFTDKATGKLNRIQLK